MHLHSKQRLISRMPTPIPLEKRVALLTRIEDGCSIAEAARRTGIDDSTARNLVSAFRTRNSPATAYRGSSPSITPRTQRAVMRDITNAPYTTFRELGRRHSVSTTAAQNILREHNFKAYATRGALFLSDAHRKRRVTWAEENALTDWRTVVFTDESAFSGSTVRRRSFVKCRVGEQNSPDLQRTRLKGANWTVHVWGAIAVGKKWPLHRFVLEKTRVRVVGEDGRTRYKTVGETIDSRRYVKDVLEPRLAVYAAEMRAENRQGRVVEDNAPIHNSRMSADARRLLELDRLDHPPNSPDLNPIEFVWNWLKNWISAQPRVPTTEDEHWRMIQDAYTALPQEVIDNCILGLVHRTADVLGAAGGPIG